MELTDLSGFLEPPSLKLPIGGRVYAVAPASGETWLRLQELASAVDSGKQQAMSKLELQKMSLGPVFEQMITDGVAGWEIEKSGTVAFYWQIGNESLAKLFWEAQGKASPRAKRSTGTTTAAGSTTRRRASTSGTSTRKR